MTTIRLTDKETSLLLDVIVTITSEYLLDNEFTYDDDEMLDSIIQKLSDSLD